MATGDWTESFSSLLATDRLSSEVALATSTGEKQRQDTLFLFYI
jgi:hypothetical protein